MYIPERVIPEKPDFARMVISRALQQYKLTKFYALFSGGHDSLTSTHISAQHEAFAGVIHIDTGTGIPETRQFVIDTCKREGWPLWIFTPQMAKDAGYTAETYQEFITKVGLPGAAMHSLAYRHLKERPLRLGKRILAPGGVWALSTGARTQESDRRMGHVQTTRKDGSYIWINPIHNWTALDCTLYIKQQHLPRNPVKDALHISGECFCGAFAKDGELQMVDLFYPEQGQRIRQWEQIAKQAGHTGNKCRWGHGSQTPDEQMELFPLCHYCRGAA